MLLACLTEHDYSPIAVIFTFEKEMEGIFIIVSTNTSPIVCGEHRRLRQEEHPRSLARAFAVLTQYMSLVMRKPVLPGKTQTGLGERGGSVVECRTPEREVGGSKPTAAVLCPWARHFTPRKYWLITQEAMAPSRHDWKIVDWDVKPQHKQTNKSNRPAQLQRLARVLKFLM